MVQGRGYRELSSNGDQERYSAETEKPQSLKSGLESLQIPSMVGIAGW